MPVWLEVERKLAQAPSTHPARLKFLDRVNFYGQVSELDPQGRVLIQPRLRDSALMTGEVDVLGKYDFLEVWNHDRFLAKLLREPYSDDDARALAEFGI
jgi:MraZ protein